MSYDILIFDSHKAPKEVEAFLEWNDKQEDLMTESLDIDDVETTSKKLQEWFFEISKEIIPLSGPYSNENEPDYIEGQDDDHGADYFFGKNVIYIMFSTIEIDTLTNKILESAQKHNLGFCDFNSSDDFVLHPK